MSGKQTHSKHIVNRRARHDYVLDDSLVVGMQLTGAETKALRLGHGQLSGAYVTIKDGELWLINSTISSAQGVPIKDTDKTRTRKLLAKQKEITGLDMLKRQGKTIIPLELLTQGRYIKLRIATGKGKKLHDKRQTLRERDDLKKSQQAIKAYRHR